MKRRIDSGKHPGPPKLDAAKQVRKPVSLSFKHTEPGEIYCLSHCDADEVREAIGCLRQLCTLEWIQVLQTAGKGDKKAGLGYTRYDDDALRNVGRPGWLSEDVKISGIRASRKMRIFGVYIDHIFYVLWFDRNHDIIPV